MSLIIPWGVFARYVLGTGSHWPEPVAVLLMVSFTFLGAAASYRAGAHIAVGMLTDRLPPAMRRQCELLVDALMVVICLFVMVWGMKLVLETMGQTLADLPWLPVGLTYLPLPIGSFMTLVFVLEKIFLGSQSHRAVVTFDHESNITVSEV
jgi:TRAP-type C4-dicarboxylate transport system permease small subunit